MSNISSSIIICSVIVLITLIVIGFSHIPNANSLSSINKIQAYTFFSPNANTVNSGDIVTTNGIITVNQTWYIVGMSLDYYPTKNCIFEGHSVVYITPSNQEWFLITPHAEVPSANDYTKIMMLPSGDEIQVNATNQIWVSHNVHQTGTTACQTSSGLTIWYHL